MRVQIGGDTRVPTMPDAGSDRPWSCGEHDRPDAPDTFAGTTV